MTTGFEYAALDFTAFTLMIAGVALAMTAFVTPLWRRLGFWLGLVDHPNTLSVHHEITARSGGAAIITGVIPCLILVSHSLSLSGARTLTGHHQFTQDSLTWFAIAALAVFLIGTIDDRGHIPAWPKLGLVAIASIIVAVAGGWVYPLTGNAWFDQALTVVWLTVVANIANVFDGLDGLATGVFAIILAGIMFVAADALIVGVAAAFAGASFGFLLHNFPPSRRIFLGDGGALMLGFVTAALVTKLVPTGATTSLSARCAPALLLAVPNLDTCWAVARRIAVGQSPFVGDRFHTYDLLHRATGSVRVVLLVFYILTLGVVIVGSWLLGR